MEELELREKIVLFLKGIIFEVDYQEYNLSSDVYKEKNQKIIDKIVKLKINEK